ncbi:MAG: trimethylamine methyltransferase family protein [Desulfobacterales bacterium]|jgi:hypothetical protein
MFNRPRQIFQGNLWNRTARDLIYDSKQVLLYCGVKIPSADDKRKADDYTAFVEGVTQGTRFGAVHDPATRRIHFEPDYIQDIVDLANRFDFPVFDKAFGPGGIAGFIQEGDGETHTLKTPSLNHILKQALMAKKWEMPFAYVCARQLSQFEIEQFGIMTEIFDGPIFLSVSTAAGIAEAERCIRKGHYIITIHTIFDSPLTLSFTEKLEVFRECVARQIPVMLVTQPFSGQNAPMTPYGLALLVFAEFLAGMALAYAINPATKVINGAYPTMCTPGRNPVLKIGSVVHNFTNYLVAYTARLLDIASIQSGCTVGGAVHDQTILDTDYETARAMILWDYLFEGWHMLRHSYGFLDDLVSFSFRKADADIAALRHIQGLDDSGITAVLANSVRLNSDFKKAESIYQEPTLLFNRERDTLLEVIIETMETFRGDFGKHEHTLKNIPHEWF